MGVVFFENGNRGSFPGTVTGPALVTAGQAHRELVLPGTVTENRLRYGNRNRTSAGYRVTPNLADDYRWRRRLPHTVPPSFIQSMVFWRSGGEDAILFFFFCTLVTGPRRSLGLKLSDTRVHEPQ